jgi:N-acetylglucosaminyldiphosphoundecaprenol N-acetyl-beta-D-mannosaminyltransferase
VTLDVATVQLSGISVADADFEVTAEVLSAPPVGAVLAFALHIGGLNAAADPAVQQAYAAGSLTYADGAAVVLLARLAGARSIERAATTDLAPLVLRRHRAAGRDRVFLLGGPPGLAEAAGRQLAKDCDVRIVGTMSGYAVPPRMVLSMLRDAAPDIVLVGLGSPREMFFLSELEPHLPPALYLTCGGWFGFLAGDEKRAPEALRRSGLEWVWRLKQHPRRLLGRYARGAWTTARLATSLLLGSRRSHR